MNAGSRSFCERARFLVSLRADGELSEFEEALLDVHLADCDACRELARRLALSTAMLRSAPFER